MEPTSAPDREQRILEIIETARSKRPRFKDERVTMAHGAGGKASQTMIEGCWRRPSSQRRWTSWATRAWSGSATAPSR